MAKYSLRLLLPLLVIGACATPTGVDWDRVSLSTDLTSYAIGQDAVVTLTNASGQTVRYSWCLLGLERRVEGEWERAAGASLDRWVSEGFFGPTATDTDGLSDVCNFHPLPWLASVAQILPTPPYNANLAPGPEYRYMIGTMGPLADDRAIVYSSIFAITP
jgi:hypothetical protein